ncbi:MAG: hypothetical protein RDU24_14735 [Humidesulfovibrio sp.]|uniref:hypothetical protein n=1 Tax=Humidesulfovibrio sp. TaxID=2910988 RepID=UPI0027FAB535|nr:hypothetical protein [Humidesulfovibrio sp.]MDQ7836636.1 hypothetical protein [Humidesulfovibrio sp.]
MSLSYDKDGFKLTVIAGVADETKGKRRWTRVAASVMGYSCSDLESLAALKACLDCFRRGQLLKGEPQPLLGTETEGVLFASRQKDKVLYLLLQRVAAGRMVEEAYYTHLDVARLEVAAGKALQFLAPVVMWGPEQ